ncbi:Aste57867_9345 [Aphanomyces stellatus]|uniref:Aste57867_9345 protein n=1 Tax=Aphanomyces stellatus TaxID=120398 RepID=A0A485KN30_9STRA|nr:hypothetical protein As57867_009309 [Aphanomyces stellatus]VFT86226.1 Aste57867_9345 [Aphanomyces stellatus]
MNMEPELEAPKTPTSDYSSSIDTTTPRQLMVLNIVFALIGIGYLFPFSALTQPVDYWKKVFPSYNIEFSITCIYLYSNLLALGLVVAFGPTKVSYTRRIVGGFAGQFIALVFVPLAYHLFEVETVHMAAVLAATAFAAIATAFLDSCVMSLVAKYPVQAQASLQFGIGLSILIGSVYRDFTKLLFSAESVVASSALYFFTGAVTVGICIASYFVLQRLPVPVSAKDANDDYAEAHEAALTAPNRWTVLRKCAKNQLIVAVHFMTSLSVWPPLVTEMKSYNCPELQANGWWPLILLTVFSIMDCIGRLNVHRRFGLTKDTVWKPVFARILLVPCIVLSVRGIWFTHDAWSILFVLLLGGSNGYLGSLSILFVNDSVQGDEQPVAGSFTGFVLNAGLVLGSTIGFGFSHLVHH